MTLRAVGTGRLRAVRAGWAGGPIAAAPCWCGVGSCWDHGDVCARCGWQRARASLARVRLAPSQTVLQCRDGCEGRPATD